MRKDYTVQGRQALHRLIVWPPGAPIGLPNYTVNRTESADGSPGHRQLRQNQPQLDVCLPPELGRLWGVSTPSSGRTVALTFTFFSTSNPSIFPMR